MTEEQTVRYSRQILLEGVGRVGQEKLLSSRVLLIGAGGLGAPLALYLVAAGVGTLGIADSERLDLSNLQRQVLFTTDDIGRPKAEAARAKLKRLNPDVEIEIHSERVTAENVMTTIRDYHFIVDATDNLSTKFLINDACVLSARPFSHGGLLRFEGQAMTYVPGAACYRCIHGSPPPEAAVPSSSEVGVLGAVAGMLGTIQAAEALKYLLGIGDLLTNRVLTLNALTMEQRMVRTKRNLHCAVCGSHRSIRSPGERGQVGRRWPDTRST